MLTARQIADEVRKTREAAWDKSDQTAAIVAMERLGPDDEKAIRLAVAAAGYAGDEGEAMFKRVAAMVVGAVQAMADDMPATGGD